MCMQCRLQMGTRESNHYHSGPRQCLQHLLKTEGPFGLTRGLKATIARETPGNAIFFTVYEVTLLTVVAIRVFCCSIMSHYNHNLVYKA